MAIKVKLTGDKFGSDRGKITEVAYIDGDGDAHLLPEDQGKYGSSYAFSNEFESVTETNPEGYTITVKVADNLHLLYVLAALQDADIDVNQAVVKEVD